MELISADDAVRLYPRLTRFREIAPASRAIPRTPDFMFGSPTAAVLASYYGYQEISAPGVWSIDRAILQGAYLVRMPNAFVHVGSANLHPDYIERAASDASSEDTAPKRHLEPHVLLIGPGYQVFGHWLADFLPKLYVLECAGYDLATLRFIVPADTPAFGLEWLRMCGIRDEQLSIFHAPHDSWDVDLLIPTIIHNGLRGPMFGEVARFLQSRIRARSAEHPARIFLSRARATPGRACRNRDEIEQIADKAGLAIVYPEQMPLADQIALYASADLVVGEYGSAMHTALFSRPGTVVCGLRGSRLHPGFLQSAMGAALRQPTGYVFGQTHDDASQTFTLDADEFSACLDIIGDGTSFEEQRPAPVNKCK